MIRRPPRSTLFPYRRSSDLVLCFLGLEDQHIAHDVLLLAREQKKHIVGDMLRSEEHTSELQSRQYLVCRLLLEKNKQRQLHASSPVMQQYTMNIKYNCLLLS